MEPRVVDLGENERDYTRKSFSSVSISVYGLNIVIDDQSAGLNIIYESHDWWKSGFLIKKKVELTQIT